jgi:hypothetical protein
MAFHVKMAYIMAQPEIKARLHGEIFSATCLATALQHKLHGALQRVTYGAI